MPWLWVTPPGEKWRLPGVDEIAGTLKAEVEAIEALGRDSACRICGAEDS